MAERAQLLRDPGDVLVDVVRLRPRERRHEADPHASSVVRVARMKIRAAVLEEFGAPLEVQELDLAEPKAGEVLVRLVACGVCHTDLYTASGADPSGYAPAVLGHEGAGVVERVGEGVTSLAAGDHVVTLFSPQCRECVHCLSTADEPLPGDPRAAEPGPPARTGRRGSRATASRSATSWAPRRSPSTRSCPRSRWRRCNQEAPLDRACLFACGLSTGLGAAINTAKVEPGSTCVVFGAGMVGLGAVAGCRLQGAERIVCVDLSEERLELARGQGATDTMVGGPDTVERILELTGGFGADYTFEATGNVAVMRQAVESARMGWGLCTVAGVAGKGETLDIVPRFLITGRRVAGSSFGGRQGPRPGAAARRPLARGRDRRRPVPLAHAHARRGQPRLRADGGPGRHPQRDPVRLRRVPVRAGRRSSRAGGSDAPSPPPTSTAAGRGTPL